MSNYRRWYQPGGTYFFTVVTYHRHRLFASDSACRLLGKITREVRSATPFETVAAVLLPDHLHVIWALPPSDPDFSLRWRTIKARFTQAYLSRGGSPTPVSNAQWRDRRRGVWQRRFWEHLVRDEDELAALCDYIHYNPVKHGYVDCPADWRWSSFRRFVDAGEYSADWGAVMPARLEGLEYE